MNKDCYGFWLMFAVCLSSGVPVARLSFHTVSKSLLATILHFCYNPNPIRIKHEFFLEI